MLNSQLHFDISEDSFLQRRINCHRMARFLAIPVPVFHHFVLIDLCLKQSHAAKTTTQKHIREKDAPPHCLSHTHTHTHTQRHTDYINSTQPDLELTR